MDHYLTAAQPAKSTPLPAQHLASVAPASDCRKLGVGKAITLRAKRLSVLRISHGRVWATLSDAGPHSRVLAGDHFLSQGQSLTLLPGQELVMEPVAPPASRHAATAHFSWDSPGTAANALQVARAAHPAIGVGVLQPLRDLRHALGLVAGACGQLVHALAHAAATVPAIFLNTLAILFIARYPFICWSSGSFGSTGATAQPSEAEVAGEAFSTQRR